MKVLLYNLKNNLALKQALNMINVQCFYVDAEDYKKPLSELFDAHNKGNNTETFDEQMIIMKDFSDDQLDLLLSILKVNKINIPLKAIVTEHNKDWTSIQIKNELLKEYLAIKSYHK